MYVCGVYMYVGNVNAMSGVYGDVYCVRLWCVYMYAGNVYAMCDVYGVCVSCVGCAWCILYARVCVVLVA